MTSRERVLLALNHKEADRVPRDLGGTESSGMTAFSLHNLQNHLQTRCVPKIFEPYQYVAYIEDALKVRFGIDTTNLTIEPRHWVQQKNPHGFDVLLPEYWREHTLDDGSTVVRNATGGDIAHRPRGGYYFDPINPPLINISSPEEIAQHKEAIFAFDYPSFADESTLALQSRAKEEHAKNRCTVFNLCCHFLAAGQMLRGYENFMVDLMINKKMVKTLLDCLLEGYHQRVDRLAPLLKGSVDVVLLNDDLGTQNGPMLALSTYQALIKPYQQSLFSHIKKAFGAPILFHSCGAVRPFIPDLIEVGVDALNPVQISATGMEAKALKHDFGNDITFWGGGIDTQTVLNKSTPAKVADAVKRNLDIFAPGGGFVFCQVHNIQPDVPPENIVAMYSALNEYGNS